MKLGFSVSAATLAVVLASACGDSEKGSLLDGGSGEGSGASANTGGKSGGPDLGLGGETSVAMGGDGSGMGEGGGSCGSTRLEAAPPSMLLVVDKSLSMNQTPDGYSSNKWLALRTALEEAFTGADGGINFGLDLYPAVAAENCEMPTAEDIVVSVQSGADAAPLILAELEETAPSGGTPTAAALTRALDYFTTGEGQALKGEKYVLLATDGGPNCNTELSCEAATCTLNIEDKCPPNTNCCDPGVDADGPSKCLDEDASVAAVAALAAEGIKIFVVGIPGTEAYAATLDLLAAESGVSNPASPPDYFAVAADGDVGGLSEVLRTITTELIRSCRLQLEETPPDFNQVFVVIDGVLIERDAADGWQLDRDTSPPTVEITGAICEALEAEGAEYINISYLCPDYEPH